VAFALAAAVLAAVNHAEVVAHRVGEPFGSLVLAVAVTIIEVGLIVTLMISGGPESASLARDTVFAAVMITCNGIVGIALLIGGVRFHVTMFNAEGTGTALATVTTLATLSLVLPTFTLGRPGPEFTPAQLAFAAIASLALYAMFVLTQTGRHRDFFLPLTSAGDVGEAEEHARAARRDRIQTSLNLAFGSAGQHRTHHPRDRRRLDLAGWSLRAGTRYHADAAAGSDRCGRDSHGGSGSGNAPRGRSPPGIAGGFPLPRSQPLAVREPN
jgi:Ca2+/H+ antiporter